MSIIPKLEKELRPPEVQQLGQTGKISQTGQQEQAEQTGQTPQTQHQTSTSQQTQVSQVNKVRSKATAGFVKGTEPKVIFAQQNNFTSFSGMPKLPNVEQLLLDENKIRNFYGLHTLKNLRYLSLADNNITSFKGAVHLPNLEVLNMSGNPIADYVPEGAHKLSDKAYRLMAFVAFGAQKLTKIDGDTLTLVERDDGDRLCDYIQDLLKEGFVLRHIFNEPRNTRERALGIYSAQFIQNEDSNREDDEDEQSGDENDSMKSKESLDSDQQYSLRRKERLRERQERLERGQRWEQQQEQPYTQSRITEVHQSSVWGTEYSTHSTSDRISPELNSQQPYQKSDADKDQPATKKESKSVKDNRNDALSSNQENKQKLQSSQQSTNEREIAQDKQVGRSAHIQTQQQTQKDQQTNKTENDKNEEDDQKDAQIQEQAMKKMLKSIKGFIDLTWHKNKKSGSNFLPSSARTPYHARGRYNRPSPFIIYDPNVHPDYQIPGSPSKDKKKEDVSGDENEEKVYSPLLQSILQRGKQKKDYEKNKGNQESQILDIEDRGPDSQRSHTSDTDDYDTMDPLDAEIKRRDRQARRRRRLEQQSSEYNPAFIEDPKFELDRIFVRKMRDVMNETKGLFNEETINLDQSLVNAGAHPGLFPTKLIRVKLTYDLSKEQPITAHKILMYLTQPPPSLQQNQQNVKSEQQQDLNASNVGSSQIEHHKSSSTDQSQQQQISYLIQKELVTSDSPLGKTKTSEEDPSFTDLAPGSPLRLVSPTPLTEQNQKIVSQTVVENKKQILITSSEGLNQSKTEISVIESSSKIIIDSNKTQSKTADFDDKYLSILGNQNQAGGQLFNKFPRSGALPPKFALYVVDYEDPVIQELEIKNRAKQEEKKAKKREKERRNREKLRIHRLNEGISPDIVEAEAAEAEEQARKREMEEDADILIQQQKNNEANSDSGLQGSKDANEKKIADDEDQSQHSIGVFAVNVVPQRWEGGQLELNSKGISVTVDGKVQMQMAWVMVHKVQLLTEDENDDEASIILASHTAKLKKSRNLLKKNKGLNKKTNLPPKKSNVNTTKPPLQQITPKRTAKQQTPHQQQTRQPLETPHTQPSSKGKKTVKQQSNEKLKKTGISGTPVTRTQASMAQSTQLTSSPRRSEKQIVFDTIFLPEIAGHSSPTFDRNERKEKQNIKISKEVSKNDENKSIVSQISKKQGKGSPSSSPSPSHGSPIRQQELVDENLDLSQMLANMNNERQKQKSPPLTKIKSQQGGSSQKQFKQISPSQKSLKPDTLQPSRTQLDAIKESSLQISIQKQKEKEIQEMIRAGVDQERLVGQIGLVFFGGAVLRIRLYNPRYIYRVIITWLNRTERRRKTFISAFLEYIEKYAIEKGVQLDLEEYEGEGLTEEEDDEEEEDEEDEDNYDDDKRGSARGRVQKDNAARQSQK